MGACRAGVGNETYIARKGDRSMTGERKGHKRRPATSVRALALWAAVTAAAAASLLAVCMGTAAAAHTKSAGGDKPKIAVVLHLRVPSLLQFCYGAETAGQQLGFDVDCVGPQKINTIQQQQIVNSEVDNRGVKGVAPLLIGAESWRRVIGDLQKRGVKVVDIGIQTGEFMGDATPLLVAPRDVRTGRAAGDIIISRLPHNPSGEVVVDIGVPGLKLCEDRFKGITQVFHEKAPNVKIIKVKVADDDVKGPIDWRAQIEAHPNALAFIGDCASTAPPILGKLKKETGGKWLVTGSELDPRTPPLIKSGEVAGVTSAAFWVQGYVGARILYEQIVNGKYNDYKGWIDSGTLVVTKKNVDAILEALKSKENLAKYYGPTVKGIFANLKAHLGPYK
jgi:ABC-type sugar transport system substrate-binding protein